MSRLTDAIVEPGTSRPALRQGISLSTLRGLPAWSSAPRGNEGAILAALRTAGFEYVQGANVALARPAGLRVIQPADFTDAASLGDHAVRARDEGVAALTLKPGTGLEDDAQADRMVEAIVATADRVGLPILIETHRSSITQDLWRTVRMVERFPEVRFTGDFSHWYTGQEMAFRAWAAKLEFLEPVFARTRLLHLRIGNPACLQVRINYPSAPVPEFVEHFRQMWQRCMRGFLRAAQAGQVLVAVAELLDSRAGYARVFPDSGGVPQEESDRYEQAGVLLRIAAECFAALRGTP
jgi:hypothetical protein